MEKLKSNMTTTEKILAKHAGKDKVFAGELLQTDIDLIVCHDVTTPPAIEMLRKKGIKKVFDPNKIVVTPDHFVPNKDIASAEMAKKLRDFVQEQNIKNYFEIGCHGICHAIVPEKGFVKPGMTIIGADSHTCTHGAFGAFSTGIGSTDLAYALAKGKLWFRVPLTDKFIINGNLQKGVFAKDVILEIIHRISVSGALDKAMEFSGEVIDNLEMEERMTICNMAIEAGAKNGLITPDQKTIDFINAANQSENKIKLNDFADLKSDLEAKFDKIYSWDFSDLKPSVALPHLPENVKTAQELEKENIKIDQAWLGSCTNGRFSDLQEAAKILRNRKIKSGVRMIIVPATMEIWKKAMKEGLFDIFTQAGAAISTPTCGACLGGYMGILAAGEKCISSTNRNFIGRMGDSKSEVFLASPSTVAASAIMGKIADPRQFL